MVVRRDLPLGVLAAQVIHATGVSTDRHPPGTYVVALAALNERHLIQIADALSLYEIAHHKVIESDRPYTDQLMALGLEPVCDRAVIRKVLSSLPLLGKEDTT